jgi:hypothetical protein
MRSCANIATFSQCCLTTPPGGWGISGHLAIIKQILAQKVARRKETVGEKTAHRGTTWLIDNSRYSWFVGLY